jgi:methionine biosynthesis protein MetW
MTSNEKDIRSEADLRIFGEWIGHGERVLDLGCGRGALLDHLTQTRRVFGVGVDNDLEKISGCLERGVNAVQGDMLGVLRTMPDVSFDWVVCSRVLQELSNPPEVVLQALRVGKRVAVAFVNNGHWRNRVSMLRYGHRVRTGMHPNPWYQSEPTNPLSITDFDEFCAHYGIVIGRRTFLGSDWKTPRTFLPKLTAGYGVYELLRTGKSA